IRDDLVTGVQTCALPIFLEAQAQAGAREQRRADRDDAFARPGGRVDLIEQVLDADEDLSVLAERARQHEVHVARLARRRADVLRSEERRVGKGRTAAVWQ